MRLVRYEKPEEFLAACGEWLEAREAENLLLLGVISNIRKHPDWLKHPPYLAGVVDDDGRPVAAAVRTPPREVVMTYADAQAVSLLVEDLAEADSPLTGVIGPAEASNEFQRQWAEKTEMESRPAYQHRYYRLTRLMPPPPRSGHLCAFSRDESGLLFEWFSGFQRDLGPNALSDQVAAEFCRVLIEDQSIYYWDDGRPTSMAGFTGQTSHGARVVAVYTPPEMRNQGYATACVAALSKKLLDSGRDFVGLAVDRQNPIPAHVYEKLGYEPVRDFDIFSFADNRAEL